MHALGRGRSAPRLTFGANWLAPLQEDASESELQVLPPNERLDWEGMPSRPLCRQLAGGRRSLRAGALLGMSAAEQLERSLGFVITHEIGHTPGLRHKDRDVDQGLGLELLEVARRDAGLAPTLDEEPEVAARWSQPGGTPR
jgi:hypothetical protein